MRLLTALLASLVLPVGLGCDASPASGSAAPAPSGAALASSARPSDAPRFVPGETSAGVAAAVAAQLAKSPDQRVLVYVGASWCEPCHVFHRAVTAGAVDEALPGVVFVEYDWDRDSAALKAAGYDTKMLPLFAVPEASGRASGRQIAGSIKGPGATQNLVPRLTRLLAGESVD
ncbi:MAG: thioredoxin family protein [Polyangiaceae bacterium]|nr:thioredoxin family protein [Polyangiaceae bacterium]